jgi:hypothetical protein
LLSSNKIEGQGDHNNEDKRPHIEYLATLLVSANPGIDPNIVTVLSIEPCALDNTEH